MKKKLFFMNKEHGFYVPYVLFVVAIFIILFTANINLYDQEIKLTASHVDQLQVETIMQMGRIEFKRQLIEISDPVGTASYSFPHGDVEIVYERITDEEYALLFRIYLRDGTYYRTTGHLSVTIN